MTDSPNPDQLPEGASSSATEEPDPRRWWALTVLAAAQLMIVLDASIVNIALPSAQDELDISNADRQWIVTAYTLAFGALLLLGGRIAEHWGIASRHCQWPAHLRSPLRSSSQPCS